MKLLFRKMHMAAIAAFCLAGLFTSCAPEETVIPVEAVALDETMSLSVGQKQRLEPIFTPGNATNQKVSWESSAPTIASVDENTGLVEALSTGFADITVTTADGNKTDVCRVTVGDNVVPVVSVSLDNSLLELMVGDTETLTPIFVPSNATVKTVTWESNKPDIVSIENGVVTARSVGVAVITVTTDDGRHKSVCAVTVDSDDVTVSFVTNGGDPIEAVEISKGTPLDPVPTPTRDAGLAEGLYSGLLADVESSTYTFDGWYTDAAFNNAYAGTPLSVNTTLYAKWSGSVPQPIDLESTTGDNMLVKAFNYAGAVSAPTELTFVLTANLLCYQNLELNNANATLKLIGKGEERVITKRNSWTLIQLKAGTLILDKNITISGEGAAATTSHPPLISMEGDGGQKLYMKEGSKITKGVTSFRAGAVYINGGTGSFYMEGGEISDCTVETEANGYAGGAVAINWGRFEMSGGVIKNNMVKVTGASSLNIAGGVYVPSTGRPFKKTGGEIGDNSAEAATGFTGKMGQQILHAAAAAAPATDRKVDDNLGTTDNLSNTDTGWADNPLWKTL